MKKFLHLPIENKILEKLSKFCANDKLNKSEIVEKAIVLYIKNKNKNENKYA